MTMLPILRRLGANPTTADISREIEKVRLWMEAIGKAGGLPTVRDLEGGAVTIPGSAVDGRTDDGETVGTPTTPQGLTATGLFAKIMLGWTPATYQGHSRTEIWRAEVDDLGQAVKVGEAWAPDQLYVDSTLTDTLTSKTYYYWIRFVNKINEPGAFNATAGTAASTADDPAYLLELLTGEILSSHLHSSLSTPIGQIPSITTTLDQLQNNFNDLAGALVGSVFFQADEPVPGVGGVPDPIPENSRWYDSDNNNKAYIYLSSTWVDISDPRVGQLMIDLTALESVIEDPTTGLAATRARLITEETTRATQDSALASSLDTLSAQVNHATTGLPSAHALITSESTARANGDTALSQSITTLQAAAISGEGGLLSDPTFSKSLAEGGEKYWKRNQGSLVWSWEALGEGGSAALKVAKTGTGLYDMFVPTRRFPVQQSEKYFAALRYKLTADFGTAPIIVGLLTYNAAGAFLDSYPQKAASPKVLDAWTTYEAELTGAIHADAVEAEFFVSVGPGTLGGYALFDWVYCGTAPRGSSLNAGIAVNAAAISTEQTARADADNALAEDISLVAAAVATETGNREAAILSVEQAIADETSARASAITTVQSQVDDNTAAIQTQSETVDGLSAQWSVKASVNDLIGGIGLFNDGTQVALGIHATKLYVTNPANPEEKVLPLVFDGLKFIFNQLLADSIIVKRAMIEALAVDDAKIDSLSVNKLIAGIITASNIFLGGESKIHLDGANNRIIVKDASNVTRVILGKLAAGYGIEVYDSGGQLILGSGGVPLAKVNGAGAFAGLSQIPAATSTTYIAAGAIKQALIDTAAVGTLQIQGEAVIVPRSSALVSNFNSNTQGVWIDVLTVPITIVSGQLHKVVVMANAVITFSTQTYAPIKARIVRNSTAISNEQIMTNTYYFQQESPGYWDSDPMYFTPTIIDDPGVGTHTYRLQFFQGSWSGTYTLSAQAGSSLVLLGAKR